MKAQGHRPKRIGNRSPVACAKVSLWHHFHGHLGSRLVSVTAGRAPSWDDLHVGCAKRSEGDFAFQSFLLHFATMGIVARNFEVCNFRH